MRRLAGFGVDTVLYAAVLVFRLAANGIDLDTLADGTEPLPDSVLLWGVLITGVYQVSLTALRGQTVGKIVVRTRVIDSATGEVPGWQSAFIRWGAPTALSTVPWLGYAALVMYAWLLWDPLRRGLHDRLARTMVISLA